MTNAFMRYGIIKLILILSIMCLFMPVSCSNNKSGAVTGYAGSPVFAGKAKIGWQAAKKEKNKTIIPGSVKAGFGSFDFSWIISGEGAAKLSVFESAGSAELPMKEKRIMPMVLSGGSTLLFHDWYPLVNEKKPAEIRIIAEVSSAELFSVFPQVKNPPSAAVPKTAQSITWRSVYSKNGNSYADGMTKASFGSLQILWKKSGFSTPELVTLETPGAGELPAVEVKLLIWKDESSGMAYLCQLRYPMLNQGNCPYLWILTAVKTEELLFGYNLIKENNSAIHKTIID